MRRLRHDHEVCRRRRRRERRRETLKLVSDSSSSSFFPTIIFQLILLSLPVSNNCCIGNNSDWPGNYGQGEKGNNSLTKLFRAESQVIFMLMVRIAWRTRTGRGPKKERKNGRGRGPSCVRPMSLSPWRS